MFPVTISLNISSHRSTPHSLKANCSVQELLGPPSTPPPFSFRPHIGVSFGACLSGSSVPLPSADTLNNEPQGPFPGCLLCRRELLAHTDDCELQRPETLLSGRPTEHVFGAKPACPLDRVLQFRGWCLCVPVVLLVSFSPDVSGVTRDSRWCGRQDVLGGWRLWLGDDPPWAWCGHREGGGPVRPLPVPKAHIPAPSGGLDPILRPRRQQEPEPPVGCGSFLVPWDRRPPSVTRQPVPLANAAEPLS